MQAKSVPIRIVEHGKKGDAPRVTEGFTVLSPEQIEESKARMLAIQQEMALIDNPEPVATVTPAVVADDAHADTPRRRFNDVRAPDGEFSNRGKEATRAQRRAQVKADLRAERELKQEESWFRAMESIGIIWAFRLFFGVIGGGAGAATLYFAISRMLAS